MASVVAGTKLGGGKKRGPGLKLMSDMKPTVAKAKAGKAARKSV